MAGARIKVPGIEVTGATGAEQRLARMAAHLADKRPLLDMLGGVVESQTRRRLSHDKEGPNGEPWPDWSERYKATRRAGHHLLESEGTLIDSIHYMVLGDAVEIGSGEVYAAIHQLGSRRTGGSPDAVSGSSASARGGAEAGKPEIPARPWLGLSRDDRHEVDEVLGDWIGGLAA